MTGPSPKPILRCTTALTLVMLCPRPAPAVPPPAPGESLARFVPADVGLFIEGRHLADILLPLTEPQAWLALAEFGGQPAAVEETTQWRDLIRQTVQMEPAEALQTLLAEQFAFVATGWARAQDAVLICRPQGDVRMWLTRWRAQPLPTAGRTSVYRLPNRVGLAQPDGLLIFGDSTPSDGMFQQMLAFADRDTGQALANDPVYQRLLARVPERPDAILFARVSPRVAAPLERSAPESAPATLRAAPRRVVELPGPLRGAAHVLLALHRADGLLHFSAVGDAPPERRDRLTGLDRLISSLPARTLLAWGLHVDYPRWLDAVQALPEKSLLRLAFQLQESSGTLQRLAEALDSATCIAVGYVEPASRLIPAPPIPALAVLVRTRTPQTAASELDLALQSSAQFCNLLALRTGARLLLPATEKLPLENVAAARVDLSDVIRQQPGGAIVAELHVCWALDGDVLIVATHTEWLRQILAARHGSAPTLASALALNAQPPASDAETIVALQAGPLADLAGLWLSYLERFAPFPLDERWWRARQPGGGQVQLGIQVRAEPDFRRMRVTGVTANSPADGILKPGDEIVACSGRTFATSQPVREFRDAVAKRPNARWIDLEVVRGGTRLIRRLALPFVDPVQMLRRVVALGKIAQRVAYHDDMRDPVGARGFLTVELRRPEQPPLFPFTLTPGGQTAAEFERARP